MTQGELINKLIELREQKRELNNQLENITGEYEKTKHELIVTFQEAGTFSGKSPLGSATLTEKTIASAANMDEFWAFVMETKDPSLVSYARPNNKACQELIALGTNIPGITLITQQDINLRSSK